MVAAMTTLTSTIPPAPRPPTPTAPPIRPRRRRPTSALEDLFVETARLRQVAVWRHARWATDAHETAAAAVWEQLVIGERDPRALYAAARRALMRLRRYEERHRRAMLPDEQLGEDPADRVAEIVDAERLARQVAAPSPAVREWIDRKAAATAGRRLSSGTKSAGQRWAVRARQQIGGAGVAA